MGQLAHTKVRDSDAEMPGRWLVILHGILGSRANWRSVARRLVRERPGWGVLLLDLRRHGESLEVDGEDTVAQAAADVLETVDALGLDARAVLGHSFGGKVAMACCAQDPGRFDHLFVVDAMPGPGRSGNSPGTPEVVEALAETPRHHASRNAFIECFESRGFSSGLSQWLAMNLHRVDDGVELRLDMDAIRTLLDDYFARDDWAVVESPPGKVCVHLIIGGASVAYGESDRARARDAAADHPSRVDITLLDDAGHWVHADDPDGLHEALASALH